jgi:tRNA-binding protein
MSDLTWDEFKRVDIRVGKVVSAKEFPEARNPSYILEVDFGEEIGVKKSSAQITDYYTPEDLIGRQVMGVVNFPPKQIGPIMSEFLIIGAVQSDKKVILLQVEREAELGSRVA